MTNDDVVRAYVEAYRVDDRDAQSRLRHRDWTCEYPQSGERIRGDANIRAILEHYPGGAPQVVSTHVVGSEDRYVVTPMLTIERVAGSGDLWWGDGVAVYPDGSTWHLVVLIELRDGLVFREVEYFAAPFEAPAWRAPFVERMHDR
jgi:hypothetical protein